MEDSVSVDSVVVVGSMVVVRTDAVGTGFIVLEIENLAQMHASHVLLASVNVASILKVP